MNDVNNKAVDKIIQNILYAVKEEGKDKYGDIIAPVTGGRGNKCTVLIMNQPYQVKNGIGVTFKPGDRCLIHCINGSFQDKVIIAKL